MNRAELIKKVAVDTQSTVRDTKLIIEAALDIIQEQVWAGGTVNLLDFGQFSLANRLARVGRNPITGEPLPIPARQVPVFKVGKKFKEGGK